VKYTPAEYAAMMRHMMTMTTEDLLASGLVDVNKLYRTVFPLSRVVLVDNGPQRIKVIKVIRTHLTLGLVEAKGLTDDVAYHSKRTVLTEGDAEAMETFAADLRDVGATVEVEA